MFKLSWRGFALALVSCLLTDGSMAQESAVGIYATSTRAIVVDARGRSLGRLIGPNQLLISYPDGDALLVFDPDGYSPGNYPGLEGYPERLLFESSDCTGRAYSTAMSGLALAVFKRSPEARAPGFTPGGVVFYPTHEIAWKTIRSARAASVDGRGPCTRFGGSGADQRVHPVNSRNVMSFQLPLSITVRR